MKNEKLKRTLGFLLIWRNIVSIVLYEQNKKSVDRDLEKYLHLSPYNTTNVMSFNYIMLFNKPFRSVFRYRISKKRPGLIIALLFTPKALDNIEIGGEIGEGLAIWHNMGCVIAPKIAGRNLSVGQGVTIGRGESGDPPIIGNNVRICTGAIVFGEIQIGDNVIIGAGTVCNKSIPSNSICVGNPVRILKNRAEQLREIEVR